MKEAKKLKGLIYVSGRPGMNREAYERFRANQKEEGDLSWPPFDAIPEFEPEADDGPSPC